MTRTDEPHGGDASRAMTALDLARLCGVPPAVVRGWAQRGLVRLPAADGDSFRQVGIARVLTLLHKAGWSPRRIERAWHAARSVVPDPTAALLGLEASLGRQRITVRHPDGRLLEPGGQLLFDFGGTRSDGDAASAGTIALRSSADWLQAGLEAEAAGQLELAVAHYERSLPDGGAEALFNLGNCLYALGRRAAARDRYLVAVRTDPDYAEAWNNLGIACRALRETAAAVDALRTAIALVPYYADAHYNLADALAASGDIAGARQHWQAYLRYDPHSKWADEVRRRLAEA